MHRPVRFSADIEPLVQFVEETDPGRILEATLAQLRDGLSVKKLLTASALAVTRSSDLPPGHHGGPLHPLDRKSTRLNSSHIQKSRMPSSA